MAGTASMRRATPLFNPQFRLKNFEKKLLPSINDRSNLDLKSDGKARSEEASVFRLGNQ